LVSSLSVYPSNTSQVLSRLQDRISVLVIMCAPPTIAQQDWQVGIKVYNEEIRLGECIRSNPSIQKCTKRIQPIRKRGFNHTHLLRHGRGSLHLWAVIMFSPKLVHLLSVFFPTIMAESDSLKLSGTLLCESPPPVIITWYTRPTPSKGFTHVLSRVVLL
jgi:hypothetical protein